MDLETVKIYYFSFLLGLPRVYASFAVLNFLGKIVLTGTAIRNGVVLSLGLFLLPLLDLDIRAFEAMSSPQLMALILKEVSLGFAVGYIANIPFWAVSATGQMIDNQRGATIMESLNFLAESQGSPLGNMMTQTTVTVFLSSGAFLLFFKSLILSYNAWPVATFFPKFDHRFADFAIQQFQFMMEVIVLLVGPVIIALFLSEVGLALISRFAPQLNVFILALAVKSALALAILVAYFSVIVYYFKGLLIDIDTIFQRVIGLLQ